MKEAEFHRKTAKGETNEEREKEGIQEVLPARHRIHWMRTELLWGE